MCQHELRRMIGLFCKTRARLALLPRERGQKGPTLVKRRRSHHRFLKSSEKTLAVLIQAATPRRERGRGFFKPASCSRTKKALDRESENSLRRAAFCGLVRSDDPYGRSKFMAFPVLFPLTSLHGPPRKSRFPISHQSHQEVRHGLTPSRRSCGFLTSS
jgi:hypothetical protein